MKSHPFEWTSKLVTHYQTADLSTLPLATKALCVVLKHFLVPMSELDLASWKRNDHFMHHLPELENQDDLVMIRPWLVGGWLDEKETLFEFEPSEYSKESFGPSILSDLIHWREHHKRGVLFGIYLTVKNAQEGWDAVFAFMLDEKSTAKKVKDLPVKEALCLSTGGDAQKVDAWLDWAYSSGHIC